MQDHYKTKSQLTDELESLRRRVAELEAAEVGRQQAERELNATLNALPDLLFQVDRAGRIHDFRAPNPELLYVPPREFLGKMMSQVLPAEASRVIDDAIEQSALHGQHTGAIYSLQTPAGLCWFELSVVAKGDPGAQEARFVMLVRDITERKRAEETLRKRAAQMALVNEVGHKIAAMLDLDRVLDTTARLIQEAFGYHHVGLFTLAPGQGELVMRAKAGSFMDLFPPGHRLRLNQGLVGWVGYHGERLLANDVSAEPRYVNLYSDVIPTCSELTVPIRAGQEIVGVLDVQSPHPAAFDENDVLVIETLADQIAIAIDNARLYGAVRHELAERQQAEVALRAGEENFRNLAQENARLLEQARQDAATKARLLMEINHRVKNNLASIIGLLYVEQRYLGERQAGDGGDVLGRVAAQIEGLAQAHDMLSATEWGPVALNELASRVVHSALKSLVWARGDRKIEVDIAPAPAPAQVTPRQANSLALIVNELTINTIKYAMPGRSATRITATIALDGDQIVFEFRNDGPGYPAHVLQGETQTLGLYLIRNITRHDLHGSVEFFNDPGPVARFRFKHEATLSPAN